MGNKNMETSRSMASLGAGYHQLKLLEGEGWTKNILMSLLKG
jgi:hypothetical protein